MEKPLAQAAGIGWQGKHTVIVSREFGNWLFLGAIFTTAELPADDAEEDRCGSCRRCLDICPTNAFPAPYRLDARRCISYLTIEHKGHIAARAARRDRQPGLRLRRLPCGVPLEQVRAGRPRGAARAARGVLARRRSRISPRLDDAAFRARFAGTPIKRTGRDRFVRNVLIAIGNSADPELAPRCRAASRRRLAARARHGGVGLREIAAARRSLRGSRRSSTARGDPAVRDEWAGALGAGGRGMPRESVRLRPRLYRAGLIARLHARDSPPSPGTVATEEKAARLTGEGIDGSSASTAHRRVR